MFRTVVVSQLCWPRLFVDDSYVMFTIDRAPSWFHRWIVVPNARTPCYPSQPSSSTSWGCSWRQMFRNTTIPLIREFVWWFLLLLLIVVLSLNVVVLFVVVVVNGCVVVECCYYLSYSCCLLCCFSCDDATCNFTTSVVLKWGSETMDCPKCKTGTIKKEVCFAFN